MFVVPDENDTSSKTGHPARLSSGNSFSDVPKDNRFNFLLLQNVFAPIEDTVLGTTNSENEVSENA